MAGLGLEKKLREGNVTIYYEKNPSARTCVCEDETPPSKYIGVIKIKGMTIERTDGKPPVRMNVEYKFDKETPGQINIYFPEMHKHCWLHRIGTGSKLFVSIPEAEAWELVNPTDPCTTPERIAKAQRMWDIVYIQIMKMPKINEYITMINKGIAEQEHKDEQDDEEHSQKARKKRRSLRKRFKGKPHPLDVMIELIESAQS